MDIMTDNWGHLLDHVPLAVTVGRSPPDDGSGGSGESDTPEVEVPATEVEDTTGDDSMASPVGDATRVEVPIVENAHVPESERSDPEEMEALESAKLQSLRDERERILLLDGDFDCIFSLANPLNNN